LGSKDVSTPSDKFELNGDVYFEKGQVMMDGYDFPRTKHCGVSDSISMNRYIDKICKELSININVGVAENAHTLMINI
jgi:hypothetical protein